MYQVQLIYVKTLRSCVQTDIPTDGQTQINSIHDCEPIGVHLVGYTATLSIAYITRSKVNLPLNISERYTKYYLLLKYMLNKRIYVYFSFKFKTCFFRITWSVASVWPMLDVLHINISMYIWLYAQGHISPHATYIHSLNVIVKVRSSEKYQVNAECVAFESVEDVRVQAYCGYAERGCWAVEIFERKKSRKYQTATTDSICRYCGMLKVSRALLLLIFNFIMAMELFIVSIRTIIYVNMLL